MSPTQTATSYVPSVRGDAMLLTHGRKGAAQDRLIAGASVMLDGALGWHVSITGRKLLGFDRRRVVAGLDLPGAPPLMHELRSRVLDAAPDAPSGWFDRTAGFALDGIAAELAACDLTTPLRLSRARRVFRHETLIVSESAEAAALERLLDALAGHGAPPSIALAAVLHACDELEPLVGRRSTRRLDAAVATLPAAAQTFLAVLRDQRRRGALIG
jgi:hypothetical protein